MLIKSSQPNHSLRRRQAFTLIEIMMTIAIIAVLAGIIFGAAKGVSTAKNRAVAKAELASLAQGIEGYKARYGDYPWLKTGNDAESLLYALTGRYILERNSTSGIVTVVEVTDPIEIGKNPKFIDETKFSTELNSNGDVVALLDPWENPYTYIYKSETSPEDWDVFGFHLYSMGPSGTTADTEIKAVIDSTTGVLDNDFRDTADSSGVIFAGE